MSSQQQPRPWFRLASMMRATAPPPTPAPPPGPPPPTTVLQPPPLRLPFRPPVVAPPQPTITPSQQSSPPPPPPVVSPPPPPNPPPSQFTAPATPGQLPSRLNSPAAPRSPVMSSAAPRSPVIPSPESRSAVRITSPPAVNEATSQQEPDKPQSPIVTDSAAFPLSYSNSRPIVSSAPSVSPSPKQNAALAVTAPRLSPQLPPSPGTKTSIPSRSAPETPPQPPSPVAGNTSTIVAANSSNVSPFRSKSIVSSPKEIKEWEEKNPPDQSPHMSRPPSPLILPPPAQLKPVDYLEPIPAEAQQKTVLTQNRIQEKSQKNSNTTSHNPGNSHMNNKQGGGGMEGKKATTNILCKKSSSSRSKDDQFGMKIITLAGENKGAIMALNRHGPSRKKSTGTPNNDEYSGENDFRKMQAQPKPETPVNAFVNSNVQEINNSILCNSAYTSRSPGVRLTVSRNAKPSKGLAIND